MDSGWTELRVHGVSGTPPEQMLQDAQVEAVAGDGHAAFFRRRSGSSPVVEAYSWGALTAGNGQRALWLLLTPFMLVNLAFFTLPSSGLPRPVKGYRPGVTRTLAEAVMRLFALSITVTFVLVAVQVAMDLIGWQCGRDCAAGTSWLGFLTWPWLDTPGRRLAVTALVPLAAVALLGWLGRTTWLRLERTPVPQAAAAETRQTPLENRGMWNGSEPVRRLRALHLTAGLAVVGVFLSTPSTSGFASMVLVLLVILLGVTVVSVCRPPVGGTVLLGIGGLLVLAALVQAVVADSGGLRESTSLPELLPVIHWLVTGQLGLLLVMVVLLALLNRSRGAEAPVWHGMAAAGLMMLALVLIGGFAAGAGIRVADLLGTPAVEPVSDIAFIVPDGYFLAAAATAVLTVVLVGLALVGWRVLGRAAAKISPELPDYYAELKDAGADSDVRRDRIARIWARAEIGEVGQRLLGWFLVITAVALAAGLAESWIDGTWLLTHARWLVNVGTFLVGGFVLALLFVGRQAYRNPRFRRTVGVLWDIGTFWPRAAHPLAPPCYTERAVPDLITRIRFLGGTGRVLLSCHSQGAVIGTAVVMQLTYEESASVALLTYGRPVHRLYARFFPEYFNPTALHRAGSFLLGVTDAPREKWPWRNLYRRSDPIGGEIFQRYPAQALGPTTPHAEVCRGDNNDVDRQLVDPGFARVAGDTCDPASCGHSNYYSDPAFEASAERAKQLRASFPSRCPHPNPIDRCADSLPSA
ncbi:hypothetical protein ACQPZX_20815 [Actinoplanes sp. CA-142083]|uniref:hypothetical protein n=1 Tax=Actinoplanes sp. CA-142083 TaxID=3239903 RepID=UPI003D8D90DC